MHSIDHSFRTAFEERYPNLQLHITGGVPMMQAFVTAAERDMATLFPIAGITLLVILSIVLGGAYLTLVMISLGAVTCLITLGMAGWSGLVLNSATSTIPIVIFALTIASTMHLFLHLARGRAIHGSEMLPTAFRSALRAHTVPIVMTLATTSIGMLSLVNVPSPPVKELGIWVTVGLTVGGLLTFTALPAVLSFRLTLTDSSFAITLQQLLNHYVRKLESDSFPRYPFIIAFLVSLIGLSSLEVDDDFVKYFDSSSQFRVDTEFAQEVLAGPYGIEIILLEGEKGDIFNPAFFTHLESLSRFLSEDERVIHSLSIYDILKSVQQDIQPSETELAEESPEYLSQLFLAYNLSLQKDQSTTDYVSFDHFSTRISVLLRPSTSSEIRQFVKHIGTWGEENKSPNISMIITGESVPTAFLSPNNITAMVTGIFVSLLCSAGIIGLYYRSLKIGTIALVSIVVPVLIGFGLWGWLYGSIGLATTVIVAITIGVVIDDSIHMIVRAKDGQASLSLDPTAAAAYSVYRVGIAIVGTTLVLVGAFSLLLLSGFELNSAFGLCTTLILIAALLFDLFFLPTLIAWALNSDSSHEVIQR
jgi:predicted RND superfamily exporter protein